MRSGGQNELSGNQPFPYAGLDGYVDGKVDRTFGIVPENKLKDEQ